MDQHNSLAINQSIHYRLNGFYSGQKRIEKSFLRLTHREGSKIGQKGGESKCGHVKCLITEANLQSPFQISKILQIQLFQLVTEFMSNVSFIYSAF